MTEFKIQCELIITRVQGRWTLFSAKAFLTNGEIGSDDERASDKPNFLQRFFHSKRWLQLHLRQRRQKNRAIARQRDWRLRVRPAARLECARSSQFFAHRRTLFYEEMMIW